MTRINPETLKSARVNKDWSLDDLARRSGIDKQSIHRIEKGEKKRNRIDVIEKLARALGLTADDLTNVTSNLPKADGAERKDATESQLNLRISDQCRNALTLTSLRYRLAQSDIVEIAPLLFCWAAETSLKRRRERHDAISRNAAERAALSAPHLHGRAFDNYNAENTLHAERESINARDVFGKNIDGDGSESYLAEAYDEETQNPFAKFLSDIAGEIGEVAEFEGWDPDYRPDYQVCTAEALALLGGDSTAADIVLRGAVSLHQMPDDLKKKGAGTDRAKWVRQMWADSPLAKLMLEIEL